MGDFDPNAEVLPYFMDCLKEDPATGMNARPNACWDIQRHFKGPAGDRGASAPRSPSAWRTTAPSAGWSVPRVAASVQREVERVLRRMPELVPGSQGGIPVGCTTSCRCGSAST